MTVRFRREKVNTATASLVQAHTRLPGPERRSSARPKLLLLPGPPTPSLPGIFLTPGDPASITFRLPIACCRQPLLPHTHTHNAHTHKHSRTRLSPTPHVRTRARTSHTPHFIFTSLTTTSHSHRRDTRPIITPPKPPPCPPTSLCSPWQFGTPPLPVRRSSVTVSVTVTVTVWA